MAWVDSFFMCHEHFFVVGFVSSTILSLKLENGIGFEFKSFSINEKTCNLTLYFEQFDVR